MKTNQSIKEVFAEHSEVCCKFKTAETKLTSKAYNSLEALNQAWEDIKNLQEAHRSRRAEIDYILSLLSISTYPKIKLCDFDRMYTNVPGRTELRSEESWATFNWKRREDQELIKYLSNYLLPRYYRYVLTSVPYDCIEIRQFLHASIPTRQDKFSIIFEETTEMNCCNYINQLWEVANRVRSIFEISNLNMTSNEFCSIIQAANNCK